LSDVAPYDTKRLVFYIFGRFTRKLCEDGIGKNAAGHESVI